MLGYEILGDLLINGSTDVLRTFLVATFNFAFKLLLREKFNESALLYKILVSIKLTDSFSLEKDMKLEENFLILSGLLEEYLDQVTVDSEMFSVYLNAICSLPPKFIFGLTASKETSSAKLRKNITIRCKALTMYKKVENILSWINPLLISAFKSKRYFLIPS